MHGGMMGLSSAVETRLGRSLCAKPRIWTSFHSQPGVPWQDGGEKEAFGKDHSGNRQCEGSMGSRESKMMSGTEMRSREAGLRQDNGI